VRPDRKNEQSLAQETNRPNLPRFPLNRRFFRLGPRGTGKTSWTRYRFPRGLRIDLLDAASHRELAARPERLAELAKGHADRRQIIIDEVQKLPELLEVVHAWIEQKNDQQFILTGSRVCASFDGPGSTYLVGVPCKSLCILKWKWTSSFTGRPVSMR
jgi:predicted AAA+ superfamily ATPase